MRAIKSQQPVWAHACARARACLCVSVCVCVFMCVYVCMGFGGGRAGGASPFHVCRQVPLHCTSSEGVRPPARAGTQPRLGTCQRIILCQAKPEERRQRQPAVWGRVAAGVAPSNAPVPLPLIIKRGRVQQGGQGNRGGAPRLWRGPSALSPSPPPFWRPRRRQHAMAGQCCGRVGAGSTRGACSGL